MTELLNFCSLAGTAVLDLLTHLISTPFLFLIIFGSIFVLCIWNFVFVVLKSK